MPTRSQPLPLVPALAPPTPPLPGPFAARATALPVTPIWRASTSESHSTSALHSTHQLAPHATPAALYAKSHTRRAILAAARLLYAQQQTL